MGKEDLGGKFAFFDKETDRLFERTKNIKRRKVGNPGLVTAYFSHRLSCLELLRRGTPKKNQIKQSVDNY